MNNAEILLPCDINEKCWHIHAEWDPAAGAKPLRMAMWANSFRFGQRSHAQASWQPHIGSQVLQMQTMWSPDRQYECPACSHLQTAAAAAAER